MRHVALALPIAFALAFVVLAFIGHLAAAACLIGFVLTMLGGLCAYGEPEQAPREEHHDRNVGWIK